MLLHIRPRLYSPCRNVALVDLAIEPLGLHLAGGVELATRRPYPNRHYAVACRKKGTKAINGILIETAAPLDEFHTTARWAIEAQSMVTHDVHYRLLDHDFDAASDDMILWYACASGPWEDRWPTWARTGAPVRAEPVMELHPPDEQRLFTTDVIDDATGWITSRTQTFAMPTIERGRITGGDFEDRLPLPSMAFRAQLRPLL